MPQTSAEFFMSLQLSDLGARIRTRRKTLGVSQRDLAEIAGVSEHTLVNLETGRANPTWTLLASVLDALGLELQVHLRTTTS